MAAALDETEMSVTDLKLKVFGRQQDFSIIVNINLFFFSTNPPTCSLYEKTGKVYLGVLGSAAVFFDYFFSRYIAN